MNSDTGNRSNCGDCNENPNPLDSCAQKIGCDNPCGRHGSTNSAACESLPSQIDNFTLQFFGEVVKTEVDGKVVWSLPCSLDTGLPGNTRSVDEPLGCYILRLFEDGILGEQGPQGEKGDAGTNGRSAYTTVAAPFATPSLEHPYVQIVTVFNPGVLVGANIFIQDSGWYNVVGTDGTGVLFANLVSRLSGAEAIIPVGATVVPAGQTGVGVKGETGDKGLIGDTGLKGPKGDPGNDAPSVTQNNGFFFTTSGFDYNIDTTTFQENWQPVIFSVAAPWGGYPTPPALTPLDPVFTLPNAGTYLIVAKSAVNVQSDVHLKLFSNTTSADVPGTVQLVSPSAANEFRHCTFACIYTAVGADEIQLYVKGLIGFMDGGLAGAVYTPTPGSTIVYSVVVQPSDQKILVGGRFTIMNGTAPRYLTRLNTDGNVDTGWNAGAGVNGGPNNTVHTIGLLSDGRIVIGGEFTTYTDASSGSPVAYNVGRFAVINTDGTLATELQGFNPTVANTVYSLDVQSDDKVVIAGSFTKVGPGAGTTRLRIARLRTDVGFVGVLDSSFGDTKSGVNDIAYAVKVLASGQIVLGGQFGHAFNLTTGTNVAKTSRIAKFDATTGGPDAAWPNTSTANQFNSTVYAIEEDNATQVLVGGSFTLYDGNATQRFVILATDGSLGTALAAGFNNDVRTIAFDTTPVLNPSIFVGGLFTAFSATNQRHLSRLLYTGILDTSLGDVNIGVALDVVYTVKAQPDGKILVGGTFVSVQTVPRGRIARLLTDGTLNTVPGGAQTVPYLYTDITWTQIA